MKDDKVRTNAFCPCGSGKRFKRCCARSTTGKELLEDLKARWKLLAFAAIPSIAVVFLIIYQNQVKLNERRKNLVSAETISVEDFIKNLNANESKPPTRSNVLSIAKKYNAVSCICGCGFSKTHCLLTDQNCPLRGEIRLEIAAELRERR